MPDRFSETLLAHMPAMRAFALRVTNRPADADDLVQEALARAWRYRETFHAGTDMKAWLFKILQNCLYQSASQRRGTVEDADGVMAAQQSVQASQEYRRECLETLMAMQQLPAESRQALHLVGVNGLSYQEAAQASACPVGTLKSRVNRAREQLSQMTGYAQPALMSYQEPAE